jgi:preprotein translocase subunit SecB
MAAPPLELLNYFLTELQFSANRQFDPSKPIEANREHFVCNPSFLSDPGNPRRYQVSLAVKHSPNERINHPYTFALEIVGFFEVRDGYPQEGLERMVRITAPSLLYGVAREVVRAATGRGPFLPVIIPTISFFEPSIKPTMPAGEPATAAAAMASAGPPPTKLRARSKAKKESPAAPGRRVLA